MKVAALAAEAAPLDALAWLDDHLDEPAWSPDPADEAHAAECDARWRRQFSAYCAARPIRSRGPRTAPTRCRDRAARPRTRRRARHGNPRGPPADDCKHPARGGVVA